MVEFIFREFVPQINPSILGRNSTSCHECCTFAACWRWSESNNMTFHDCLSVSVRRPAQRNDEALQVTSLALTSRWDRKVSHGQHSPASTARHLTNHRPTLRVHCSQVAAVQLLRLFYRNSLPGFVVLKRTEGRLRETPWRTAKSCLHFRMFALCFKTVMCTKIHSVHQLSEAMFLVPASTQIKQRVFFSYRPIRVQKVLEL